MYLRKLTSVAMILAVAGCGSYAANSIVKTVAPMSSTVLHTETLAFPIEMGEYYTRYTKFHYAFSGFDFNTYRYMVEIDAADCAALYRDYEVSTIGTNFAADDYAFPSEACSYEITTTNYTPAVTMAKHTPQEADDSAGDAVEGIEEVIDISKTTFQNGAVQRHLASFSTVEKDLANFDYYYRFKSSTAFSATNHASYSSFIVETGNRRTKQLVECTRENAFNNKQKCDFTLSKTNVRDSILRYATNTVSTGGYNVPTDEQFNIIYDVVAIPKTTPIPTQIPTAVPTNTPTQVPTAVPTNTPTQIPTQIPTVVPTNTPTQIPTQIPTAVPTNTPTQVPTAVPTNTPTQIPTAVPTNTPTQIPTAVPTVVPTQIPTAVPTVVPTVAPLGNVGISLESMNGFLSSHTIHARFKIVRYTK